MTYAIGFLHENIDDHINPGQYVYKKKKKKKTRTNIEI